jgi:ATP phosphoribosyltransferase
MKPLSLAIPKGRLQDKMLELLHESGVELSFEERKLTAADDEGRFSAILVKNSDLTVYVTHGIAGLGICGEDLLFESGRGAHDTELIRLGRLPFGSTKMCVAALSGHGAGLDGTGKMVVATKFPRFTQTYFHDQGRDVEIIKLNGSVELAPLLSLAPYIVDIVETGTTLKANGLEIVEELRDISVFLVANPSYYKLNFGRIDDFVRSLGMETAWQ